MGVMENLNREETGEGDRKGDNPSSPQFPATLLTLERLYSVHAHRRAQINMLYSYDSLYAAVNSLRNHSRLSG